MKRILLLTTIGIFFLSTLVNGQNVFNPADPIVRYNSGAASGSAQNPDQNVAGLQKWVSTATIGISSGSGNFDASSYKAYFININGSKVAFRMKFPRSYSNPDSAGKTYPMMMFFHGAGEAGCASNGGIYNNEKQLLHGGRLFRDAVNNNQFDGFLIYPQSVTSASGCFSDWGIAPYAPVYNLLFNVVDSLAKYVRADVDRLFVNGLSNGGLAAFSIATVHPERVAAAGPSAAATSASNFADFLHVPFWFASGQTDTNPTPGFAATTYNNIKDAGGNIRWTLYPGVGHAVWGLHWAEPGYMNFMSDHHKANPHVFFMRSEYCPDSLVSVKIGISPRYHSYEWQKDNVTIATRVGTTNTIVNGASIVSFEGNNITVRSFGVYRVRFKRTATSDWSAWSPKPAHIKIKGATQTPNISVTGIRSKVLPALDGSTTVPLELPPSFLNYQWVRASDNITISTQRTVVLPVGEYKAKTIEQFGCGSLFSPIFRVVDANGSPKPEPAKNLAGFTLTETSVRLDWSEHPNPGSNETGFEIYRSNTPGGPYQLLYISAPDVLTYTNTGLESNKTYYYIIRAVNEFGAAKNSNEASVSTVKDVTPPTAPSNLQYRGSTQSTVDLAWTGSTDNVAVDRYDVFVNGTKIYSTTGTSGTVSGLDSLTLYTFVVKARDAAGNYSQSSNQESGYTHRQGINFKYYIGSWTVLPNFGGETIRSSGTMKNVSAGIEFRTQESNYGIMWEGFIYIPAAGIYTFETNSDDGSKLLLAPYSFSATPVVQNDSVHNMQLRSGTINLNRGYYAFTIPFFDRAGNEGLEAYWTGPGITRQRIPDNYLSLTNFTIPSVPATPASLSGTTPSYSQVNLSWTYNTNSITGFEVVRSTTAGGTYLPIGTVASTVRSFIDSNRNSNTQYFYKVRAIRAGNYSAFSNTLSITTPNTPPAPPEPPRPTLTIMSTNAIRINWNDNAPAETGWQIERSINNNAAYRLVATLPAVAGTGSNISYIDSNLFANVVYWYRVRAVGNGTLSPYSLQATIRTPNTKPVFTNLKDFTMKINTTYALPIEATDVDGDALTFTAAGLPYFATIQNVSNGNANIVFSPSAAAQGAYSVAVFVNDGNNGRDTTYFTVVVNENGVPVMNALANITMDEGELLNVPLVANDQEGNSRIFWYFENKPSFVTFTNNGNGRGSLRIAPSFGHSGIYRMTVFADDGYGAWTSRSFTIEVVDTDPNETIQANFTYFNDGTPKWNEINLENFNGVPFSISNMKNVKDSVTTVGINAITPANPNNDGAQSPSNTGVFPNSVMKGQIQWGFFQADNSNDTMRLRVSGLSVSKKYNFIFFGSNTCNFCGLSAASVTTYKIGNQSAAVNFYNNTTMTDTIYQVSPNATGEIFITMIGEGSSAAAGGVLNALVIQSQFDDGSAPAKPEDLQAVFTDNVGVQLSWKDQSYNENAFQVYRSATLNGGYVLLNNGMNNKDSVSYTDENTQPFTQYYYYVRGINTAGPGVSSDTIGIITGNSKPQITGLENMFAKIGTTKTDDFSVSDSPGDILTVALVNSPSFVSLIALGGNNYRISASPTTDHIGWQQVTVRVTDDKGGITNQTITITVADSRTRSFYINLGQLGTTAQAPWNNWINQRVAGNTISNLTDENAGASTIGAQLVHDWSGFTPLGHITGNESGVFPDAVLRSGLSDNSGTTKQIRFTGLDNTKRYNIVFVGSQNEGLNAVATYSSGSQSATLNARYNTQQTASLNGLSPASGIITVTINKDAGSPSMFLNGIQIEEYAPLVPSSTLLNPLNLYVEPRDRNSVLISWTDRSVGETGFQLQRATNPGFTGATTTSYGANVTMATVTGLNPNARYYFRVRAANGTPSTYSNAVSTITPQQMVMVNFNFTVESAPFPWNNLELQPNLPETYNNLKDQSGVSSGIGLTITKVFNGEFNAGMNTGSNSGIVPDNVLQANYWLDNSQQSQIRITGLNQTKHYRFGFVGSSSPNGWFPGNYTATYTIGNRTTYLNSWQNTSKIVYIGDVLPDSNGEVLLNFSSTAEAAYAFNAGILIEAYNDAVGGTVVNGMVFEGQDVETGPLVAADDAAAREAKVRMYPNPFADNVNIDFVNSSPSNNISVDVVDLSGKLVYRRAYGKLSRGYTTLRLNTADGNIRKGVYFFILNVNGMPVSAGKLVRTRQ